MSGTHAQADDEDLGEDRTGDALGWLHCAETYRCFPRRLITEADALDAWAVALCRLEGLA